MTAQTQVAVVVISLIIGQIVAQQLVSWPVGFLNIPDAPSYEYGPSIIIENGMYYAFYCAPGDGGNQWDQILMSTASDIGSWSVGQQALAAGGSYDYNSVCDPSVVQFKGVWYLYHTCISTVNSPDGYLNNRICVATADNIAGPYYKKPEPVVEDLSCAPTNTDIYCVGQPSAVVFNNQIYLFFTEMDSSSMPGPNPGYVYLATSPDGINFEWANNRNPVFMQRDVDVKLERSTGLLFLTQGDVGDTHISYSFSKDGINWVPYSLNTVINTNPNLPSQGSNNNPGLASLSDGSFSGETMVVYGSSYVAGWGDWHLYASILIINPAQNNCSGCMVVSCDFQCQLSQGNNVEGYCGAERSENPLACCGCNARPATEDCSGCATEGCVAACLGAGYNTGICGVPGSTDPTNCCSCVD